MIGLEDEGVFREIRMGVGAKNTKHKIFKKIIMKITDLYRFGYFELRSYIVAFDETYHLGALRIDVPDDRRYTIRHIVKTIEEFYRLSQKLGVPLELRFVAYTRKGIGIVEKVKEILEGLAIEVEIKEGVE